MSEYSLKPGVVTGEGYKTLVDAAKKGGYALPAVNVVGTNSRNAVMEAAAAMVEHDLQVEPPVDELGQRKPQDVRRGGRAGRAAGATDDEARQDGGQGETRSKEANLRTHGIAPRLVAGNDAL